jgi:hypothetical protein
MTGIFRYLIQKTLIAVLFFIFLEPVFAGHILYLSNQDRLSGQIIEVSGDSVLFQFQENLITVKQTNIIKLFTTEAGKISEIQNKEQWLKKSEDNQKLKRGLSRSLSLIDSHEQTKNGSCNESVIYTDAKKGESVRLLFKNGDSFSGILIRISSGWILVRTESGIYRFNASQTEKIISQSEKKGTES